MEPEARNSAVGWHWNTFTNSRVLNSNFKSKIPCHVQFSVRKIINFVNFYVFCFSLEINKETCRDTENLNTD